VPDAERVDGSGVLVNPDLQNIPALTVLDIPIGGLRGIYLYFQLDRRPTGSRNTVLK